MQIIYEQIEADFEFDVYNGEICNPKRSFSDVKGSFLILLMAEIFRK